MISKRLLFSVSARPLQEHAMQASETNKQCHSGEWSPADSNTPRRLSWSAETTTARHRKGTITLVVFGTQTRLLEVLARLAGHAQGGLV